jgi:hypothetical protein
MLRVFLVTNNDYMHAHYLPIALEMNIRCGLRFSAMLRVVDLYFVQKTNLRRITSQKSEVLSQLHPDGSPKSRNP